MKISVIGAGYVGATTAICMSQGKNEVILMDIDKNRVKTLSKGDLPIYERGLKELYDEARKKRKISVTSSYEKAVKNSEISFICVGTPSKENGAIDLSYVEEACDKVGEQLLEKKKPHTLVIRSTVKPGTTDYIHGELIQRYCGKDRGKIMMAMHPEHLVEGNAVEDFMKPSKLVIGQDNKEAGDGVVKAYLDSGTLKPKTAKEIVHRLKIKEAEMEKYFSNVYLAAKISFANEMANICDAFRVDYFKVRDVACKDPRLDSKFTNPGIGFGGSCFPKDVKAIAAAAIYECYKPHFLEAVLEVNKWQPEHAARTITEECPTDGNNASVFGVTFKGNTDDLRETPVKPFVKELQKLGWNVRISDPLADPKKAEGEFGLPLEKWKDIYQNANLLVIGSDHPQYKEQDFINMLYASEHWGATIFDAKNMMGGKFKGIGRMADKEDD